MRREYAHVTLDGAERLVDASLDNPGEMFFGEGDEISGDAHARIYDLKHHLLGVWCGHAQTIDHDPIGTAHVARSGTVYCPHSQMRESVQ